MINFILNKTPYFWESTLFLFAPISYFIVGKTIQKRGAANKNNIIIPLLIRDIRITSDHQNASTAVKSQL